MKTKALSNYIMNSVPAMLITAVVGICMGLFFIFYQGQNKPIERADAVSYSGTFDHYESSKNYKEICFENGSRHSVYPYTESREFRESITSIAKGTRLHILVNPNNDCVIEVKTDAEEILNFESSQTAIDKYDNWYIVIGCFAIATGVFLIIYAIYTHVSTRRNHDSEYDNDAVN